MKNREKERQKKVEADRRRKRESEKKYSEERVRERWRSERETERLGKAAREIEGRKRWEAFGGGLGPWWLEGVTVVPGNLRWWWLEAFCWWRLGALLVRH